MSFPITRKPERSKRLKYNLYLSLNQIEWLGSGSRSGQLIWVSPGKEEVLRPPLTRRASANNAPFLPTLAQPKLKVPGRCSSYFGHFRHRHRARARPSAAILRTPINLLRQFGKRQSKAKQPRKANTPKKKQKKK